MSHIELGGGLKSTLKIVTFYSNLFAMIRYTFLDCDWRNHCWRYQAWCYFYFFHIQNFYSRFVWVLNVYEPNLCVYNILDLTPTNKIIFLKPIIWQFCIGSSAFVNSFKFLGKFISFHITKQCFFCYQHVCEIIKHNYNELMLSNSLDKKREGGLTSLGLTSTGGY